MDFKIVCSNDGSFSLVKFTIEEINSGVFKHREEVFERFRIIAKSGDRLIKSFSLDNIDGNEYEIQTEDGLEYITKK